MGSGITSGVMNMEGCSDRLYGEWLYQCELYGIAVIVDPVVVRGYSYDQGYVELVGYGVVVREYIRSEVVH